MPALAKASAAAGPAMPPPTTSAFILISFLTNIESFDFRKVSAMAGSRQGLVEALGLAVQRYQRSTQAFDDAVGRRLGLGPSDIRCLDWLADGPKTAGQLSKATGLRPAATTTLIDRLVAKRLVERIRDDGDRRQVLVQMTEEGQARTWELYGPLATEGQQLLAQLKTSELELMLHQLESMRELTDKHRARLGADS
jgi:DNA-binding MarR family transcriptional regulator